MSATPFYDALEREKRAQLGKDAEKEFKEAGDSLESVMGGKFEWERVLDARAVRGRMSGRVGDFVAHYQGQSVYIEIKKTAKNGLPSKNFPAAQIARCKRRNLAGFPVYVAVFFEMTKKWSVAPINYFFDNKTTQWSLDGYPEFDTAKEALKYCLSDIMVF